MLKKALHIVCSIWLALLLLTGGTATEFIHMFADHQDTQHSFYNGGPVIENEHHHCTFLSFSLPAFNNDISVPVICFIPKVYFSHYTEYKISLIQSAIIHTSLRGPPTCIA